MQGPEAGLGSPQAPRNFSAATYTGLNMYPAVYKLNSLV